MLRLSIAQHINCIHCPPGTGQLGHDIRPCEGSSYNIVQQHNCSVRTMVSTLHHIADIVMDYPCHMSLWPTSNLSCTCVICHKYITSLLSLCFRIQGWHVVKCAETG